MSVPGIRHVSTGYARCRYRTSRSKSVGGNSMRDDISTAERMRYRTARRQPYHVLRQYRTSHSIGVGA
eukprot:834904-Rhodomonas_salina.5